MLQTKKGAVFAELIISVVVLSLFIMSSVNLYRTLQGNVDKAKNSMIMSTLMQNAWKEVAIEDYDALKSNRRRYRDSNYDLEFIVGSDQINKQGKTYKPVTINVYDRNSGKMIKTLTGRKPKLLSNATGVFAENGWTKLPNGMIYQWGYKPNDFLLDSREMENVKIAYIKKDVKQCFNANVTIKMSNSVGGTVIPYVKSVDNTGIIVNIDAANGAFAHTIDGLYWQAICQQ